MSEWNTITGAIDRLLPEAKIFADLWNALEGDYGDRSAPPLPIEVPDNKMPLTIPRDAQLQVVGTSCTYHRISDSFGAFRVRVAVGGCEILPHSNVVRPGIVFVTLIYSEDGNLISYDLYEDY